VVTRMAKAVTAYSRNIFIASMCNSIVGGLVYFGNAVLYIPRAMIGRVDGEESILGTELVEPK
jgi:hypothetical protein